MTTCIIPKFDHFLWNKAERYIDGGNCHDMANIMSSYQGFWELMSKDKLSTELLNHFINASNDLTKLVNEEETRRLNFLAKETALALGWN